MAVKKPQAPAAPEGPKYKATPIKEKQGWTSQLQTSMANRVVRAVQGASDVHKRVGSRFYNDWNEDVHYLADKAGPPTTHEHVAAALARLSPGTEAESNRMMGYQMLSVNSHQAQHIHAAAEFHRQADQHPEGSPQHLSLKAAASASRRSASLGGTPLDSQSSTNISMALRHFHGETTNPLETLGKVKISDFGRTLHNPNHPDMVVDTHFHDLQVGRTDLEYKTARGLGAQGRYDNHQAVGAQAYRQADRKGIIDARETTPNAFMGMGWYAHQQNKVNVNFAARRARSASESRIANFTRAGTEPWNPAAHGQRPALNHIQF